MNIDEIIDTLAKNGNTITTPKHPLQNEIKAWPRRQYFYQWFFDKKPLRDKKKKINRLIDDLDFFIKMYGKGNEAFIKYRYSLKQLNNKKLKC